MGGLWVGVLGGLGWLVAWEWMESRILGKISGRAEGGDSVWTWAGEGI